MISVEMRIRYWTACLVVLLAQAGLAQTETGALRIQSSAVDSEKGQLQITLTNVGTKTITAYALRTKTQFVTHPFIEDFFSSVGLEHAGVRLPDGTRNGFFGGIRPGETKTTIIPGELSANPSITAVVFDDKTTQGGAGDIARIAKMRHAQATELSVWCGGLPPLKALTPLDRERGIKDLSAQIKGDERTKTTDPEVALQIQQVRAEMTASLDQIVRLPTDDKARALEMLESHCAAAMEHAQLKGVKQ